MCVYCQHMHVCLQVTRETIVFNIVSVDSDVYWGTFHRKAFCLCVRSHYETGSLCEQLDMNVLLSPMNHSSSNEGSVYEAVCVKATAPKAPGAFKVTFQM